MTYKFNAAQKKWLKALESGEYEQSKSSLCNGKGFCCIGVACEVVGLEAELDAFHSTTRWAYEGEAHFAPPTVMKHLRLRSSTGEIAGRGTSLTLMNDQGKSFQEIAAFIRANPEKVFHS